MTGARATPPPEVASDACSFAAAPEPRAIVALVADDPRYARVPNCDLCRAAKITPWHHEDDICWIAECDICEVPMVVWRYHGVEPPPEHMTHMHAKLREIATRELGEIYLDDHMRNIPDHYHAHARPKGGFFGHGLRK